MYFYYLRDHKNDKEIIVNDFMGIGICPTSELKHFSSDGSQTLDELLLEIYISINIHTLMKPTL
jgi:hypothetical protein